MSIINDALKKTQQARKVNKVKRPSDKISVGVGAKPMAEKKVKTMASIRKHTVSAKPNAGILLKTDFWLTWKTAVALSCVALFLVAYTKHMQTKAASLRVVSAQPHLKSRINFEGVLLADSNRRTALVNKQALHLGDTLHGMKIIAINQDTLDLQGDKGIMELKAGATYEL